MIRKTDDILQSLLNLYENGPPKGYSVNLPKFKLDFVKGGCTDITGYPYFGKSIVLKEFLMSLAVNHNWKHLVWLPDDGAEDEIVSNLLYKATRKTFRRKDNGEPFDNTITKQEIMMYAPNVLSNFLFLEPGKVFEPKEIWSLGKENKCQSTAIDSWNYCNHGGKQKDSNYLSEILSYRNSFFQDNNMHSFTIIHPKNPDPKSVQEGKVRKPTVYDLMGGSEWNNNGRNIIVVHKRSKDYDEPYLIYTDKVKPKNYGDIGMAEYYFDWKLQKFYWIEGIKDKHFAYGDPIKATQDPMDDFKFRTDTEDTPF